MRTRVAVSDQLGCPGIKVLLGTTNRLSERSRNGVVEYANAAAWPFRHFQAEQSRVLFLATRAERPNLAAFQRLVANAALALQFRRGNELLNALGSQGV